MDGQTHREVDRWMDTQRGRQMDGHTERWTDGWTHTEVNRWMDTQRWTDGWTDREVDRWMDRHTER